MNQPLNTGELIKNYFELKRIRRAALARVMGKALKTLLSYEKNSTIQTRILWDLSIALKYNFFMDIALLLPKEFHCGTDIFEEKNKRINDLEKELEQLKKEKQLLVDVLKK